MSGDPTELTESQAQIAAESEAEERAAALYRERLARLCTCPPNVTMVAECAVHGTGHSWRPVTEWDGPEMPPCTHDPDAPGTEEFFPDPDAEPPF